MKPSFLLSSRAGMAFMVVCLSIITIATSCSKKYDPQPEPIGDLKMRAINTVKDITNQDLIINGAVKVDNLAYSESSPYFTMTSGISTIGFYNTGTTSPLIGGGQTNLPLGVQLSTYLIKKPNSDVIAILVQDGTTAPAAGKAKVKFFNLNNVLNNTMSVTIDGASDPLIPSIQYGEDSNYFEVNPGAKFIFTPAGGSAVAAFDGALLAGKVYTIWIDGNSTTELVGHVVEDN